MKHFQRPALIGILLTLSVGGLACKEEVKVVEEKTVEEGASGDSTNDSDSNDTRVVYADAYYTSYDGSNDYSLMLLGEQTNYEVKDESMATIEEVEVELGDEQAEKLAEQAWDRFQDRIQAMCGDEDDDSDDEEDSEEEASNEEDSNEESDGANLTQQDSQNRPRFGCDTTFEDFVEIVGDRFRVLQITPLKAGVTELEASDRGRGRNGNRSINLVITETSSSDFEAGDERYNTPGEGNLKACASCHLSGEENAPPHALGRVKDFSDEAIEEWVTTGEYDGEEASVQHTWEFSSDSQKRGIIPFLRSLQSKDTNSLIDAYIAELEGEFEDGIGGSN